MSNNDDDRHTPEVGQRILCCPHLKKNFGDKTFMSALGINILHNEEGVYVINARTGQSDNFTHIVACDDCASDPEKMLKAGGLFQATWGALN